VQLQLQLQLQLLQLSIVLVLWLWDFLFGELSLEKDALSWLSVGSSVASGIILSRKGYGARGWLRAYGWVTIVILSMVKRAHRIF
jgi:hypothetical protein